MEIHMRKDYLTVSGEAAAEIEEKRSRFIATVKPVSSEQEAQDFISRLKTRYWDASHNVYAYYVCSDNILQKFSDDGEPSGTAGLPVLEAIKKTGVEDVAIVVTRYFGGILLGASGLVRAYGKSAALSIEAAGIVRRQLCIMTRVTTDYPLLGKLQAAIASKGYIIKDTAYTDSVAMDIYIPVDEFDHFTALVTEVSNGRAGISTGDRAYITKEA